ncbi:HAD family hydrolase [Sulfurimonas sp. SAG-AH-194-C20]|nr:HAD family hydrolase [Sulfurimonas sp. SAG-AH-194-C20]MDF1879189.1 HAD family hydrolase [Sulfurimonas sp. SAG-AH-194-C20]
MQKIVIFDMDGTLIDSKKDITISVNYVRELHYDLEPLSEEFIVDAINKEVRNLPELFYSTQTYEKKDMLAFEAHYEEQCVKSPYLYDGIQEMLDTLKDADVKLSVATNAPTKFAKRMLGSLNVADYFDVIIGADAVSHSKPSPEMLHKILDFYKYDKDNDHAMMIGDNSKDILSAQNAKIDSLFATWGFSPETEFENKVDKPKDILDIVL